MCCIIDTATIAVAVSIIQHIFRYELLVFVINVIIPVKSEGRVVKVIQTQNKGHYGASVCVFALGVWDNTLQPPPYIMLLMELLTTLKA